MFKRIASALLLILVMFSCFALVACDKEDDGGKDFVDPSEWDEENIGGESSGGNAGDEDGVRGDAADSSATELPKIPF